MRLLHAKTNWGFELYEVLVTPEKFTELLRLWRFENVHQYYNTHGKWVLRKLSQEEKTFVIQKANRKTLF